MQAQNKQQQNSTVNQNQSLYRNPGVFNSSTWQKPTEFQQQTQTRLKNLQATARTDVQTLLNGIPARPEEPTKQVQVENYLEALPDKIEEQTHETQTDPMQEVREPAVYREPPQGVEKDTQIFDGDLFNFDREVQPILDVLVGSVLQQSLTEFADEEEIRLIREARQRLKQKRAAELQEVRRLEEAEKRKREEIQRRQAEDLKRKLVEETLAKKIQSQLFARQYCKQLEQDVLDQLEQKGAFTSKLENAVTGEFIPHIINLGIEKARARENIHALLKTMIMDAVKKGIEMEK
ncbi:Radial-spoke_protein [Hexamita inflata]|uniref:Radial-spoke protein n=1 Tax=Hexamita inflata TaxID=28002 RepID=A0AA86VAD3_9EUKA|nr:Radial-spoke protein [Hexamita inflata]